MPWCSQVYNGAHSVVGENPRALGKSGRHHRHEVSVLYEWYQDRGLRMWSGREESRQRENHQDPRVETMRECDRGKSLHWCMRILSHMGQGFCDDRYADIYAFPEECCVGMGT